MDKAERQYGHPDWPEQKQEASRQFYLMRQRLDEVYTALVNEDRHLRHSILSDNFRNALFSELNESTEAAVEQWRRTIEYNLSSSDFNDKQKDRIREALFGVLDEFEGSS